MLWNCPCRYSFIDQATLINYVFDTGFRKFWTTAVVIMSRFPRSQVAVPPVEQAATAADLSRPPMSHDKAMVRTQVERIDGVAKAWFDSIHGRDELLKRGSMGGANGSRECAR